MKKKKFKMNFFKEFFDSLVSSYIKNLVKKEKIDTKKEEKVKKQKEKPLIIRKFPREEIVIEKIAAKELMPKIEKKEILPSLEITKEKISGEKKEKFNFGKINEFLYDNRVDSLKIISGEKIMVIYKDGKVEEKNAIMEKEEIINLLKKISNIIKIPLENELKCYFEDFFIDAKIDEKIFLNIKKII